MMTHRTEDLFRLERRCERRWIYYRTRRVVREIGFLCGRLLHIALFLLGCVTLARWLGRLMGAW